MKLSFIFLELLAGFLFLGVNTNSEEIRGVPGVDYPTFFEIPVTSFRCSNQKYVPGFYADPETGCQVFHYCYNNRQESYLCPTGTIFNQAILACDYWYSSDCVGAASLYNVNNYYQSRALNIDLDDGTSGDFGTAEIITSEPETSNVQYEALDVMPNDDENKFNQVISGLESYLPEKYPREADEKLQLNIAVKNNLDQGNAEYAEDHKLSSRLQNLTEYSDQEALVDVTAKGSDGYDRYPQFVASSGPVSQPLINSSESVYEKLAELYNTNSRLPKNENYRDYTEQQLRSLIEEIRDYEHERLSERDKNYMFRPYIPKEDTEDYFSGLSDSEFNSKLMENSRNDEESKINGSEDESKKLPSEVEWDYDYSEAEEDRLSYLHNLRIQELQASYPSNSNQDYPERNFNKESNQQSELPNISTNKELLQAPDDMGLFSKRLSATEGNKNKLSRRDPIYVVPEMANEAPKLPLRRKRPRGYPFGIQNATDVVDPTVSEVNVENITSNGVVGENEADQKKISFDTDPETLNTDPAGNVYTEQTKNDYSNQNFPSQEDYSLETEYNKEINIPPGNVYTASTDFDDFESDDFQHQNSYIFSGNEYDPNAFHNSEENEWSYTDYSQSDFENEENTKRSRVDYLRVEEKLPSAEEYDGPLFQTNAEHIPGSAQGEYFSNVAREYPGEESFHTLDYTNTLSQLNKRQRNVHYPPVNSENEDTYTDSELSYQEEFQENAPMYASDSYTNDNINSYSGDEKYLGSYEDTYVEETSDVDFENTLDQNDNEMTAELDSHFSTSEESEENSLQAEKDQSEDSETLSQDNFRNNPQNVYMDPEGNLFYYYIESEMTQNPPNIYGATPNDAESYLQDTDDSLSTDTVTSGSMLENSFFYGQGSGSTILEVEPDSVLGEEYAKNIMKMPDSDFKKLLNSPEFSEITEASNIQSNDGDFSVKSSLLVPDASTEEQNEYNESLNDDSFQEENIEPEETANISSLEHYEYGNYPQYIYRDPEGNLFSYIDREMPQDPQNSFQLKLESTQFSNVSVADPGLLFENAAEEQNSDSNTREGETDVLGEKYAQNIMKMSDAEFKEYVNSPEFSEVSNIPNSQYNEEPDRFESPDSYTDVNSDLLSEGPIDPENLNEDVSKNSIEISPSEENLREEYGDFVSRNIYTDSEGNLFYYVKTEMGEDYEDVDRNLNAMASDLLRPGSSWKFTSVDGQNSFLSTPEAGQSDTASEQVYAENIMKMSDAEFKEYLNSQFSEENDIPDTQYNEKYVKNEKRPKYVNQAFVGIEDNIGERFRPPVDELDKDVQKWPNRFELLDPYVGTREKVLFSDQHIDRGEGFDDDTLQKRVETDVEEGSSQENDFVNSRNIYTDSEGNMFYYYYDEKIAESDENLEGPVSSEVSSDDTFGPDSSEETAFAVSHGFDSSQQDKLDTSLDETYAKNIMEMSDTDFKDYLSQEFTQEPDGLETQFDEDKNIMTNKEKRQLVNRFNYARDNRDEILRPSTDAMDENVQSISNRYESIDFGDVRSDQEFPFNEQQNEDYVSLNEEGLQQHGFISQDYDELSQEYDNLRSNPQNVYVDSQGNMYYYVIDAEDPVDPQDVDSEAESSLESTMNSDASDSDLLLENAVGGSRNSSILEENDSASEAFLKNIMKMSDDEFGAYLSSQDFKEVTDVPDIPYNENKLSGEKEDNDSIQELNEFESGIDSAKETSGTSTGHYDSKTSEDTNQIPTDSTNPRVSEPPNSETAVESIDVNKDDQDELYGDFSDLFAALAKEPGVNGQETKGNFKTENAVVQEKQDIGISQEDAKSTGYQSSKSSGNDFSEQMAFKPLVPPSSNMAKASEATFIPNNLRPGDEKHFFEINKFPQGINSFQYQQYSSSYPSQPLVKKSLPVQPARTEYKQSQTRKPTFGGTLRSMKKSKLQMLGIYAKALRQRLF